MIRLTVPYGNYPVSKVEFFEIIMTVMLNKFISICPSPSQSINQSFICSR